MYRRLATILMIWVFIIASARAQWTEPVRISEPGGCLYPQILAQGDTLHAVFMHWITGRGIGYVRSSDAGMIWSTEYELTDTQNTEAPQFPKIMSFGNSLLVLWKAYFTHGVHRFNIGYSISSNYGLTWSEPSYILNPNWSHILYFSASGNGTIVNVILSSRINNDLVFFNIRSTDFSQSWSGPVEIFRAAQTSLFDQAQFNENIHFSWAGRFVWEGVWETYYMRSTDNGLTWSDNIMLSEDDQEISQLPSICTDEAGHMACTWWDFKYSPYGFTGDVLIRQSYDGGITWEPENQVTAEHRARGSDVVWHNRVLHVGWRDYRFGNVTVYYVSSPDSIHDWSNKVRLEEDSAESNYPALAVSNEKVYVVWVDDRCDPDTNICGGVYFTRLDSEVGIQEEREIILPDEPSLDVYPNPFNSSCVIAVSDPDIGFVEIYDISGRRVELLPVSDGQVVWEPVNHSSGIYFARAKGGNSNATIKLLYLK